MINNYIFESLKLNNPKTINEFENVLREISQKIILYALSQTSFFKYAAFYGGTCLRMFHGLNRFSEDLDFQVTSNNYKINLDDCVNKCIYVLDSFGLKAHLHTKSEYDQGEVRRRYIKIAYYDIANEYFSNVSMNKEKLLSIKIEISTIFIAGAKYEMNMLQSPLFSNIYCFDYSSLFARKLNALITRNWRERTKGRDYFDYMFYLSHNVKFNMEYLKNKLQLSLDTDVSTFDLNRIKDLLITKFNDADYDMIKKDIYPFINNDFGFDSFNKEMFLSSIKYLDCE